MKLFLSVLLCSTLFGCATGHLTENTFTKLPADNQHAQIYIYRPAIPTNSMNPDVPVFFVNDTKVGPLQMSGYYSYVSAPGPTEVPMTYNGLFGTSFLQIKKNITFTTEAGKIYFVRLDGADFMDTSYILRLIPNQIGLLEIQNMQQMQSTLFK